MSLSNGLDGNPRSLFKSFDEILKRFGIKRTNWRKYYELLPDNNGEIVSLSTSEVPDKNWINNYAEDYSIIEENSIDTEREKSNRDDYIAKATNNPDYIRIWFSWVKDGNDKKHAFTGVYKLDVDASNARQRLVWRKIADTFPITLTGKVR